MNITEKGYQLIKHYEGCKLHSYQDGVGVWTIGYGNTFYPNGVKVRANESITQNQAELMLPAVVARFEKTVTACLFKAATPQQFDAMVSLCYNIGGANFKRSSLVRLFNEGNSMASQYFLLYIKAGGKVVRGLENRRRSEKYLFDTGELKYFN